MFRKTKWKIMASIFLVLILVFAGTFGVIYWASYTELSRENQSLLREYADGYSLREEGAERVPEGGRPGGSNPMEPPHLELSTFYSVAVSEDGQLLRVDTANIASLDADSLVELAVRILDSGKTTGVERNLTFLVAEKEGYQLVAFLDNTVVRDNSGTLLSYTLVFGCAALVPLLLLARFLAGRIVSPLEESYKRQRQFISDAGHELKTPVAVVNANLELLSREIGENQWLSNIEYENERMSGLITQLLELAKTENVTPPMEILDLSHLVLGEALPFESVAYENGIRLETEVAEGISLCGNSLQLKQLVSILIDNGLRHSAKGQPVVVCLQKRKGAAVLSVANAGEEIPPEKIGHIFERFYRSDEARTDNHNYGLGLAIAKAIVTGHHGTIEVQCEHGTTVFTVKIPVQMPHKK